jgi:antitoxin MazE
MQVRVSRWGNSLAVRLPKQLADQLGLAEGQTVDMSTEGTVLELKPVSAPVYRKYDRELLISQIDPDSPEESFDDGPMGRESL